MSQGKKGCIAEPVFLYTGGMMGMLASNIRPQAYR
jgi:hypothetical protein